MREHRTYQCRIATDSGTDAALTAYAALYSKAERTLFARLRAGGNLTDLKREFIPKFGITARQFNAMSAELKGKIASIKERRTGLIQEMEKRIGKAKNVLAEITDPAKRHQKKRRIANLVTRLDQLKADKEADNVRLCFGSKKLFRAQFSLEANEYVSRADWKKDWQQARSSQFFVIGSKDETAGCQGCVSTAQKSGSISLKLRMPNALAGEGKYLDIPGLRFSHGHNAVVAAIGRRLSDDRSQWQAINYRFVKDAKGWRVFVTASLPEIPCVSQKGIGVVGIDINADHLAVTETDRFGNPAGYFTIPCVTYGKTSKQRLAAVGDAVKQVVEFAVLKQKPLVIEKLDFAEKKAALEKESRKYARMLSSFAYTGIQTILRARAFDSGIEVHEVNPAYTSVIGRFKFSARYGMSVHHSAALVIGRRFMGLRETLPNQLHGTLPLSVRNRGKHVWSKWAAVSRISQAALAAHGRSRIRRDPRRHLDSPQGAKARLATTPSVAGEIPAGESLPTLFG